MNIIPIKQIKTFQYHEDMTLPLNRADIFVFGSNESGIHGAGSAYVAREKFGAQLGIGFGQTGRSFAIPTKDWLIDSLPLDVIEMYVSRFAAYTLTSSDKFFVTRIGCGLAGFSDDVIALMFRACNRYNCNMPVQWKEYLEK